MMKPGVNEILKIYLGTGDSGGYQPIGCDERLRRAYPKDHEDMMRMIAPYLKTEHVPDWSKHDSIQEADLLAAELRKKFPELEEVVVQSLANRFAFNWR